MHETVVTYALLEPGNHRSRKKTGQKYRVTKSPRAEDPEIMGENVVKGQ